MTSLRGDFTGRLRIWINLWWKARMFCRAGVEINVSFDLRPAEGRSFSGFGVRPRAESLRNPHSDPRPAEGRPGKCDHPLVFHRLAGRGIN